MFTEQDPVKESNTGAEDVSDQQPPPLPERVVDSRPIQGWGAILDALLKQPDRLAAGLTGADSGYLTRHLTVMGLLGMAAYGVVVGLFPGKMQIAVVPVKLALGLLASAVICWPSLYILLCLSGGRQSARDLTGLLAASLTLLVVLMAGFAPVAWIFTQSTHSAMFMGGMHLVLWLIACLFALRRLEGWLTALNDRSMQALPVWCIIFMVVCLQMTTTLRPLMGDFAGWDLADRDFFLHAWFN
ncbi:MAG: hypothetical protein ACOYOU_09660 [Kiritimatiellia bacterium]